MTERGRGLRLDKTGSGDRVVPGLLRNDLDRHFATRAGVQSPPDLAHSAAAQPELDLVGTERASALHRHWTFFDRNRGERTHSREPHAAAVSQLPGMQRTILDRLARQDPRHFQIGALVRSFSTARRSFTSTSPFSARPFSSAPPSRRNSCARASGASRPSKSAARSSPAFRSVSSCGRIPPSWRAPPRSSRLPRSSSCACDGKHVFNPTNFGLVAMMLVDRPRLGFAGPVGQRCLLRVPIVCAGSLVVHRAARSDVTFAFLSFYALLLFATVALRSASRSPSAPPAGERRAPALRLLHDLGSEDDAGLPAGRVLFAAARRGRRGCDRAVPALPDERPPLVARALLARSCR